MTPKCWGVKNVYIFFFLDTRQMVHFLHLTRVGDPREVNGFQAEAESYLWMTDSEYEFGDKEYPRTNHACNHIEFDGHDTGGDDEAAGMFPAEDVGDEVVRHVRNIVPLSHSSALRANQTPPLG